MTFVVILCRRELLSHFLFSPLPGPGLLQSLPTHYLIHYTAYHDDEYWRKLRGLSVCLPSQCPNPNSISPLLSARNDPKQKAFISFSILTCLVFSGIRRQRRVVFHPNISFTAPRLLMHNRARRAGAHWPLHTE